MRHHVPRPALRCHQHGIDDGVVQRKGPRCRNHRAKSHIKGCFKRTKGGGDADKRALGRTDVDLEYRGTEECLDGEAPLKWTPNPVHTREHKKKKKTIPTRTVESRREANFARYLANGPTCW